MLKKNSYKRKWGTKVGRDCISLDTSLTKWLGRRLVHLGQHTGSHPCNMTHDEWRTLLVRHGNALTDYSKNRYDTDVYDVPAQEALAWVSANLGMLWD